MDTASTRTICVSMLLLQLHLVAAAHQPPHQDTDVVVR